MRSRYSAYVRQDREYLLQTWHGDFRPGTLALDDALHWLHLDVIDQDTQNDRATVEFEALLLREGRVEAMHENSRFLRLQRRWFYTEGDPLPARRAPWKPGRNESCPCGSGKKFKRCCGR